MAELVRRSKLNTIALVAATALAFGGLGAFSSYLVFGPKENPMHLKVPKTPPQRTWCFRGEKPSPDSLTIYTETFSKSRKGKEIGSNSTLRPALSKQPALASSCDLEGNLWWVTETSVFKGKIVNGEVKDITQIDHTRAPEYRFSGTKIIAADIMWLEGEERPYIATITNTGYFQAFRLPVRDFGIRENFIIRLSAPDMPEFDVWPAKDAVIGIIDANHFSIVLKNTRPLFFQITFPGGPYTKGKRTSIETVDMRVNDPSVETITDVQLPVWDETRGGLATLVTFGLKNGKTNQLPILLKFE